MSGSKKYSVSLPEDLAEAVRSEVGPGGFSAYVTQALAHQVAMDRLGAIVDDYERDQGRLSEDEINAARALLRQDGSDSAGSAA